MKILLVEDDPETVAYIRRGLLEHGHTVDHAADGHVGLMLADGSHDVLVIDRMLPRLDGLGLLRVLRAGGIMVPVLFLTALGSIDDRLEGFAAGGDDYLVKPFAFAELYARIQALARRPAVQETVPTVLRAGDLSLDRLQRRVMRGDISIDLQPTEFRILEYLLRHAGQVVTRTMLLEGVWEFHFDPGTSIVETHISRLRAKVDRGFARERIQTVRGAGYRIDVTP